MRTGKSSFGRRSQTSSDFSGAIYESGRVIKGRAWGDQSTRENPFTIDTTITIETPDRFRYDTDCLCPGFRSQEG